MTVKRLPDVRALQNRLAHLESKIEGVEADYGYGKVFAMHLQSDENPVCPVGTFKLWEGFSLVKAFVSIINTIIPFHRIIYIARYFSCCDTSNWVYDIPRCK